MTFTFANNTPVHCPAPTPPVQNAVRILRRDMATVLTRAVDRPGTIEIRLPEAENPFDESYRILVTADTMCVTAASSLGAVHALLRISRDFLGVTPLWFWQDLPPAPMETAQVAPGEYAAPAFFVRFRGWFINDEVLLDGWHPAGREPDFAWRMALEALLRLGGNMVIPGTDHNSRKHRQLAGEMGLWITHHHAEPLGAELFARAHPALAASYPSHGPLFDALWQQGIDAQAGLNVVWALGFRGQGDRPFWTDDPSYDTPARRGRLISDIIRRQYAMVKRSRPDAVCCVNLYGETMELYRDGCLDLPEDVLRIWADSGYGKMVSRRQGNHDPRVPSLPDGPGRHGVYYHASFYDLQASNHLTMLPNPPQMVSGELGAAFAAGARDYLLVNCGSLRPHGYVLDCIASLWRTGLLDPPAHLAGFVDTYYGGSAAIAALLRDFSAHTLPYGPNADERAGEEIYHYPVRHGCAARRKRGCSRSGGSVPSPRTMGSWRIFTG